MAQSPEAKAHARKLASIRHRRRNEPDLDPVKPLAAAHARRMELKRQHHREAFQRRRGRLCEILVHLLHQADLGTPKPPVKPFYPSSTAVQVFQYQPRRPAPDWRTLLPPAPGPIVIPQRKAAKTHGYGSPIRTGYRP